MVTRNQMPLDAVVALVERALHGPLDETARTTLIAQSRADVDRPRRASIRCGGPSRVIDRIVFINDIAVCKGGATALTLLSAQMLRQHG